MAGHQQILRAVGDDGRGNRRRLAAAASPPSACPRMRCFSAHSAAWRSATRAVYLDAISLILKSNRRAWLVLAGRDGLDAVAHCTPRFQAEGVAERVRIPWAASERCAGAQQDDRHLLRYVSVGRRPDAARRDASRPSDRRDVACARYESRSYGNKFHDLGCNVSAFRGPRTRACRRSDGICANRISIYFRSRAARSRRAAVYQKASLDCNAFDKSKRYAADMQAILVRKLGASGITVSAR